MKRSFILSLLFSALLLAVSSCDADLYEEYSYSDENTQILDAVDDNTIDPEIFEAIQDVSFDERESYTIPEETTVIVEETTIPEETQITTAATEIQKNEIVFPSDASFDPSSIPEYTDKSYFEVNANTPFYDMFTDEPFQILPELDSLGRCGTVFEMLGPETMPETEREGIGMIKPSGWHTVKYPELISDLYLYNRCHLIGFQLSGLNADERNLITGTKYMNVSGMLQFEDRTASYIKESGNHVLYRVTPVFEGSDLVARGVLMEALSVEDNGSGLRFCVFCYNVQPGIGINYSDGESWVIEEPVQTEPAQTEITEPEEIIREVPVPEESIGQDYILNTNTKKFHYPYCSSVNQMKEKNKREFTGTRDEVINQGFVACKNCNP